MLRVAYVEDNPDERAAISQNISNYLDSDASFQVYSSAVNFLNDCKKNTPDIAILDIELPDGNGLDIARQINSFTPFTQIVFLTNYLHYCSDAYETQHIYFIEKQRHQELLPKALDRAFQNLMSQKIESIHLKTQGADLILNQSDILYCERLKRKTNIICANNEYQTTDDFEQIMQKIRQHDFVQCYRFYLTNLAHVKATTRTEITMDNGIILPIGRAYAHDVRKKFQTFIENKFLD